jgi:TRAP-type C4-dicarboxylate transport system permease small subunit
MGSEKAPIDTFSNTESDPLSGGQWISESERHLKVKHLDVVELLLMWACGLLLFTFTLTVFLDVVTRLLGAPLLWLQEATLVAFVWGVFMGAAVALRRNEHFYLTSVATSMSGKRRVVIETFNGLVMVAITLSVAYFGWENFLQGFGNELPVTGMPLATLTGAVPAFGILTSVFALERLIKGWQNGFEGASHDPREQALKAEGYLEGHE